MIRLNDVVVLSYFLKCFVYRSIRWHGLVIWELETYEVVAPLLVGFTKNQNVSLIHTSGCYNLKTVYNQMEKISVLMKSIYFKLKVWSFPIKQLKNCDLKIIFFFYMKFGNISLNVLNLNGEFFFKWPDHGDMTISYCFNVHLQDIKKHLSFLDDKKSVNYKELKRILL